MTAKNTKVANKYKWLSCAFGLQILITSVLWKTGSDHDSTFGGISTAKDAVERKKEVFEISDHCNHFLEGFLFQTWTYR